MVLKRNLSIAFILSCLPGIVPMSAHATEPFVDHRGDELAVDGPVLTPIAHEKYYRGEELFGYNPRYFPEKMGTRGFFGVSFAPDNRPYLGPAAR